MGNVERLEAAIEKLAKLKAESDYHEQNGWLFEVPDDTTGYWPTEDPRQPITNDPLIVTLHRTIDTQLAFLHEAHYQLTHEGEHVKGFLEHELNLFMRLTDAILDN